MSLKSREILSQIRLTAAEILAASAADYIAKSFKLKGGETPWGFYYDFVLSSHFSEEMLPLIEERMRQITAQNIDIKIHEMIPENGGDYLRHHRHHYGSHFAQASEEPLVKIIQIGEFVDHISGKALSQSGDLSFFRLLGMSKRPDISYRGSKKNVIRIYGTAFQSKSELKAFIRNKRDELEKEHQIIGQKLNLFNLDLSRGSNFEEQATITWRGEGEEILSTLKNYWRRLHLEQGFELIMTSGKDIVSAHENFYRHLKTINAPISIAEMRAPCIERGVSPVHGLLRSEQAHRDCAHIFCLKKHLKEKLTSSLQLLGKIPKIFDLRCEVIAIASKEIKADFEEALSRSGIAATISEGKKTQVTWNIEDGFNHFWRGPNLSIKEQEGVYVIKIETFSSFERLLALILENGGKDLSQKKEILSKIKRLDE